MDVMDDDILNLWKALDKFKVAYIMVGGFATNLHGFSRITADLDIWLKDSAANRKNFRQALNEAGVGDFKELEQIEFVAGWTSIYLDSGLELDIMTNLKGFPEERFDECYQMAPIAIIHDIPVRFLHLSHLIEAKKASARPKDLLDIEELNKLSKP
ncbi:MAG: hypothetical protein K1X81_01485 [Bacteroidia bacterium]|nr:hypothetical protein [Bacteroidia bacterium]